MLIGPMLGRLTPLKDTSAGQEFPEHWYDELYSLDHIKANCLEWLIINKPFLDNPLFYSYKTLLAKFPIVSVNVHSLVTTNINILQLNYICKACTYYGIERLTLPFIEASSFKTLYNQKSILNQLVDLAEQYPNLSFSFETDLEAKEIRPILDICDSFYITYDTGNATASNLNHQKEIENLADKIDNVHLKDRLFNNGPSVKPFTGDTDFKLIFKSLKSIEYKNPFILETFRGNPGEEIVTVKNYIKQFKEIYV
jgi:hypothetical protein